MENISYDVRIYATDVYKGKKVTTYWVRWKVAGKTEKEPFRNSTLAESFRSELVAASRKGEAFSTETGRPVSWQRSSNEMTWYEFTCKFVDMKWDAASAIHRRDISRALIAATPAMIPEERGGRPEAAAIRKALRKWGYNKKLRAEAPHDDAAVLDWLSRNTANVSTLANPANARETLNAATTRIDGNPVAASTARRNRTILGSALDYAQELGVIQTSANPIRALKWKAPPTSSTVVDRRSVVNSKQARALLDAVGAQKPSGPRLKGFFAIMYFAGARPEEAVNIGESDITFPSIARNEETQRWEIAPGSDGWGELEFSESTPDVGRAWTNEGEIRDRRQLKHRNVGETRPVPMCPDLSLILWTHIQEFGTGPDGKLFRGIRGRPLSMVTIRKAWIEARRRTFTPKQRKSRLAKRIYDIRHAALSGWLNAGVPPTQVAELAGHSVKVLLEVYAKCIDGQDEIIRRRIADAQRADGPRLGDNQPNAKEESNDQGTASEETADGNGD